MAANGSGEIRAHVTNAKEAMQTVTIEDLIDRSMTMFRRSGKAMANILFSSGVQTFPSWTHGFVLPHLKVS